MNVAMLLLLLLELFFIRKNTRYNKKKKKTLPAWIAFGIAGTFERMLLVVIEC